MAKRTQKTLTGFQTLNLGAPSEIPANHWSDSQNMVQATDGLWENRKGVKSFTNSVGSSKKIHSIHFWKPSAGTSRLLTVGSGTALYSYAEGTAYNNGTFTSRQTGFGDGLPFEFAQYKDYLLATNGTQSMYSTQNNTSWTQRTGGDTKIAKYIQFANDIGYCADVSSARSVLYYGAAVPANPWDFANSVDIESDNGQIITGLTNLGAIQLTGKNKSIYSVNVSTPAREQLDYGAGIVSHRSIVKAENNIYVASDEGIFTVAQRQGVTSSLAATPLSQNVSALWDMLTSKGNINGIYYPKTRSIYWAVTTASQNYVLVYNVQYKSWSYLVGVNSLDWTLYEDSSGAEKLIYGDSAVDKIRELNSDDRDDDGSEIISFLLTGSLNFGTDGYKVLNYLEISGYGSELMELDYELYFDEEDVASKSGTIDSDNFASTGIGSSSGALASGSLASGSLSGSVIASSDLEVKFWIKRIPLERTFRTIRIKLSNGQAGVRWRFKGFLFDIEGVSEDLTPSYLYN